MSASISSLIADELDVSPKKAKKLLIAMLREVNKRARREGVQLPEFGTFREENGQLTFEPGPSLSRAVNHRFEGLEPEDLTTAPEDEDEEAEDDEGPSTITLGYESDDWAPLDSGQKTEQASEEESDADTEEFEVPSAEEAADTDELQAPDTTSPEPSSADAAGESDPSKTETEELYPLVEDVPGEESSSTEKAESSAPPDQQTDQDGERESLSDIWDSSDQEETTEPSESEPESFSFDDPEPEPAEPEPFSDNDPEPEAAKPEPAASSSSSLDERETTEVDIDPEAHGAVSPEEAAATDADDSGGSTGTRVAVGLLVLLLLGGAGWYLLGQRDMIQPPRATFAQLKAQIQPHVKDVPLIGQAIQEETDSSASSLPTTADAEKEPAAPSDQNTDGAASDTSASPDDAEGASSSQEASSDETTSDDASSPASRTLTPSAGGWTVIVASRTERSSAQSLASKYRGAFENRDLPVGMIEGQANGQTRYRIGVGQFDSQSEVESFIENAGAKLPQGAWPFRLQ